MQRATQFPPKRSVDRIRLASSLGQSASSTCLDDDAAYVIFVTHAGCHKAHLRYTCRRSSEMSRAVLQESARRCSEMAARSRQAPHCVTGDCSLEKDNSRHRPPSAFLLAALIAGSRSSDHQTHRSDESRFRSRNAAFGICWAAPNNEKRINLSIRSFKIEHWMNRPILVLIDQSRKAKIYHNKPADWNS